VVVVAWNLSTSLSIFSITITNSKLLGRHSFRTCLLKLRKAGMKARAGNKN